MVLKNASVTRSGRVLSVQVLSPRRDDLRIHFKCQNIYSTMAFEVAAMMPDFELCCSTDSKQEDDHRLPTRQRLFSLPTASINKTSHFVMYTALASKSRTRFSVLRSNVSDEMHTECETFWSIKQLAILCKW